jgi:hypothetical protein
MEDKRVLGKINVHIRYDGFVSHRPSSAYDEQIYIRVLIYIWLRCATCFRTWRKLPITVELFGGSLPLWASLFWAVSRYRALVSLDWFCLSLLLWALWTLPIELYLIFLINGKYIRKWFYNIKHDIKSKFKSLVPLIYSSSNLFPNSLIFIIVNALYVCYSMFSFWQSGPFKTLSLWGNRFRFTTCFPGIHCALDIQYTHYVEMGVALVTQMYGGENKCVVSLPKSDITTRVLWSSYELVCCRLKEIKFQIFESRLRNYIN